jgi:hypothetical protein
MIPKVLFNINERLDIICKDKYISSMPKDSLKRRIKLVALTAIGSLDKNIFGQTLSKINNDN